MTPFSVFIVFSTLLLLCCILDDGYNPSPGRPQAIVVEEEDRQPEDSI